MKNLITICAMLIALAGFNVNALPITATSGSSFTVDYDGIGGSPVGSISGLTASIDYYNFLFTYDGSSQTTLTFDFNVRNTSSSPVSTSRVSTMGFNTTPDILSASVSGIFSNADTSGGNVPNQGFVEFCFSNVNCAGGGGGGVTIGNSALGAASLLFAGNVASLDFDMFTVRYQSLTCIAGFSGNCPGSASGRGHESVPEPGMVGLLAIGLICVAVTRRRIAA